MIAFRIAAACCLGLEMLGYSFPGNGWLPLTGSTLAQVGIVFGITFIALEFREPIVARLERLRRRRRQPRRPPPPQ